MGQRSSGVEPVDDHFEGNILVLVSGQAARSHLGQQFGDSGIAGHIDPQHQRVDEKAHQVVKRGVTAPSDREPHRHIRTRAEPGQQHRQGGLNHHETGRIVRASHVSNPLLQLGGPVEAQTGAALVSHRWVRPIGGQLHTLGHPGQRIPPVRQLRGDQAVPVVQITKLRALPQRVIDVLHRQIGPIRGLPRTPARIGHAKIVHQRGDRQAVGGDMVRHGHQHVFVVADAEKPCLHGDLGRQVKRVTRHGGDGLTQLGFRPAGGIDDGPTKVGPLGGDHDLLGYALGRRKQRAQALMSAHHIGQRRTQRLGIQPPPQPEIHRHVVSR